MIWPVAVPSELAAFGRAGRLGTSQRGVLDGLPRLRLGASHAGSGSGHASHDGARSIGSSRCRRRKRRDWRLRSRAASSSRGRSSPRGFTIWPSGSCRRFAPTEARRGRPAWPTTSRSARTRTRVRTRRRAAGSTTSSARSRRAGRGRGATRPAGLNGGRRALARDPRLSGGMRRALAYAGLQRNLPVRAWSRIGPRVSSPSARVLSGPPGKLRHDAIALA